MAKKESQPPHQKEQAPVQEEDTKKPLFSIDDVSAIRTQERYTAWHERSMQRSIAAGDSEIYTDAAKLVLALVLAPKKNPAESSPAPETTSQDDGKGQEDPTV